MTRGQRAALAAVVAGAALLFVVEGLLLPGPWLPLEESATLVRARGGSVGHTGGLVGPLLLAPAARTLSPSAALDVARVLAALLAALAAIPIYLLARGLVPPVAALGVAALGVLAPGSIYGTAALPDTLALLLALWSLAFFARGRPRDLVVALAFATAAAFVRPWFVVLPPALLVGYELLRPREGSWLRWPRSLVFAGWAVFAYFLLTSTARSAAAELGRPGSAARTALASLAAVVVGTAVVPWLVAAGAVAARPRRAETALLVTCGPALLVAAGAFGAAGSGVDERPLLLLVPLVLALALSAWLGADVRLQAPAVAAIAVALAALALPRLDRVAGAHAAGLALVAPYGASGPVLAAGVAAAVVLALAVLLVLGRSRLAVAAVVCAGLLAGQAAAFASAHSAARAFDAAAAPPRGWVDEHAGENSRVFVDGAPGAYDARTIAALGLWNRSVAGSRVLDPSHFDLDTGLSRIADSGFVLVRGVALVGAPVARSSAGTLLRVPGSLQLTERVDGLYPDGWSGAAATYRRYVGPRRPGKLRVTISRGGWHVRLAPAQVIFRAARPGMPLEVMTGPGTNPVIHAGETLVRALDVPAPPFVISVGVAPTFSPAQFGRPDQRQLGARLKFAYKG